MSENEAATEIKSASVQPQPHVHRHQRAEQSHWLVSSGGSCRKDITCAFIFKAKWAVAEEGPSQEPPGLRREKAERRTYRAALPLPAVPSTPGAPAAVAGVLENVVLAQRLERQEVLRAAFWRY